MKMVTATIFSLFKNDCMKRRLLIFAALAVLACSSSAQQKSFIRTTNAFLFSAKEKTLKIEFCTPAMFRVRGSANGTFEPDEPWMVIKYDWSPVVVTRTETKDAVRLHTASLPVVVKKSTLTIDVIDQAGKVLSSEAVKGGGVSTKGG